MELDRYHSVLIQSTYLHGSQLHIPDNGYFCNRIGYCGYFRTDFFIYRKIIELRDTRFIGRHCVDISGRCNYFESKSVDLTVLAGLDDPYRTYFVLFELIIEIQRYGVVFSEFGCLSRASKIFGSCLLFCNSICYELTVIVIKR